MQLSLGSAIYTPGRVFCIAQNYRAHVSEMKSTTPQAPVIFLKPPTSLVPPGAVIPMPTHGRDFQYEAELVLLIGCEGRVTTHQEYRTFVAGVSLGLDLTLRDVQADLKRRGLPWEASKAFECGAPVGTFVPLTPAVDPDNLEFICKVNGEIRQRGKTREMIFSSGVLLEALSRIWLLRPGDLVFTGTPQGVGPLAVGDEVQISSPAIGTFTWRIAPPWNAASLSP
ncbi:MAG: fumarylacetoacetate hydrolase family protein [Kiritimatiellia bacterium]